MNAIAQTDSEQLTGDFRTLLSFLQHARVRFLSDEMLRVLPLEKSLAELVHLGWLQPEEIGRWTRGYAAAGALERELCL